MDDIFRLFQYTTIKDLNVLNCPIELEFSSMNIFLGDILAKNPAISRFCKIAVTDKHRLEAVYLAKYKWTKEEEERKKLEEEERKKAELEAEQEG